ncbi:MAG TPA: Isoquinoline 1-oxidoreductase subunit [Methyloceanibacter sp.]|jgi:hypothetical protein|nr:Isoquinoline 1-oxidoreductase subunit [Methyloceanibacter sp.]
MKIVSGTLAAAFFAVLTIAVVCAEQPSAERQALKPPEDFAQIADQNERSLALFGEAAKVITHPRCVNCHPAGDRPSQGEDSHPHLPLVVRGPAGFGAVAMQCVNCHGAKNYDAARIPGHPKWHLAPIEMAWQGKTLGEICEQIKDPKRNGGMTLEDLVHHMAEDSLVGWGWNPGAGREPAPGTQKEFGALVEAWVASGAACPLP